jgi:DNA-binding MarR family transcriptional regulator
MTMQRGVCPSSDEKVALFGLLLQTNARLSKDLGAALEGACELPLAWFEVLMQLREAPEGRLKMNQMAEAIFHSSGGTTRLIDRLEGAGFVTREHCPSDRRAIFVAITEAGHTKLDEALGVHLTYLNDHLAARLSDTERLSLTTLLTKLNSSS